MKRLFRKFKDEDGVVMIIVSLLMVALLSITALVTDLGLIYYKRSQLQNAVDSAALAAVYVLPDKVTATAKVMEYMQKNGYSTENVTVFFPDVVRTKEVKVTCTQTADQYFANIFGVKQQDYTCTATAQASIKPTGGAFDYLIFSGCPGATLEMKTNFNIYGSVHSNGDFSSSYNNGYIMGGVEAVGNVFLNDGVEVGASIPSAEHIDMYDFRYVLEQVIPGYNEVTGTVDSTQYDRVLNGSTVSFWSNLFTVAYYEDVYINGNVTFQNGLRVNGKIVVNGSVTVKGKVAGAENNTSIQMSKDGLLYAMNGGITMEKNFRGAGCLFAKGSLNFANGNVFVQNSESISLYSSDGNINMNFGGTNGYGIIYAPKGNVTVNGGNTTWHGSIIGWTLSAIPANITMYSNDNYLPFIIGSRAAILIE